MSDRPEAVDGSGRGDGYEAPSVARVPLEEGTVFTAAIVSNSMGMECT